MPTVLVVLLLVVMLEVLPKVLLAPLSLSSLVWAGRAGWAVWRADLASRLPGRGPSRLCGRSGRVKGEGGAGRPDAGPRRGRGRPGAGGAAGCHHRGRP